MIPAELKTPTQVELDWDEPRFFKYRTLNRYDVVLRGTFFLLLCTAFSWAATVEQRIPGHSQSILMWVFLVLLASSTIIFVFTAPSFQRRIVISPQGIRWQGFSKGGDLSPPGAILSAGLRCLPEINRVKLSRPKETGNCFRHGLMMIEPKYGKPTLLGVPNDVALETVAGVLHNNGVAVTLSDWTPFVTPLGVIPTRNDKPFCAPLQNGYVKMASNDTKYSAQYRISISTDKLEKLVDTLVERILPQEIFAILDWYDIRPDAKSNPNRSFLTALLPKERITSAFKPYMFRLLNDAFVAFRFACSGPTSHEEIFVKAKKIVKMMTSKAEAAEEVLRQFSIVPIKEPRFIDEFQTFNGDLRSLAEIFPIEYAKFKADEYLSSVYVPELVQLLSFKEK